MKSKHKINHMWLILGTYGVWFAIFSGLEEALNGKYWKLLASLTLGLVTYIVLENYFQKVD